ncbi:MAG: flagellar basal body rod protein FlgC [Myxococcaceae bacterium]|jgi:flagellar basal-body rod protein FlgC|nr:flagellar basal body rod protein FlgC [Myxococcaceae bacterium]MCA3015488.1 flagellar basal body rod protein FlgC [Myxococcaceae bacterium]
MDFLSALKVAGSGLSAQRTRVNVAATNLANAESTRGPDGQAYRRRDPVLAAVPFEASLLEASGGPLPSGPVGAAATPASVVVTGVQEDPSPGKKVYLPGHPDADPNGFVTFPNVNPVNETVNLITAQRGYDANATAVETLKTMAQRALDIAR